MEIRVKDAIDFITRVDKLMRIESISELKIIAICHRQAKTFSRLLESHYDGVEDDKILNASVDSLGNIVKDQHGQLVYSKKAMQELTSSLRIRLNKLIQFTCIITADDVNKIENDAVKRFLLDFMDSLIDNTKQ